MSKAIKSFFSSPKWLISAILTGLFFAAILPHNESVIFVLPYESHKALRVAETLKLLFLPILFCLFYFILNFTQQIINKNSFYRLWLKMTLIYGGIMLLFFIFLYPGHWVGDEFHILDAVRHYSLYSWQNYLTNIFYTFSLYLIPSGVGIVVIQLGVVSLITGYIITLSKQLFQKRDTHYLLFIPFLFFPVILNNLYPLRLTMVSYLILLLITLLIFLYRKVLVPRHPRLLFLQVSFVIAVVCFWRTEAFIYLLLLPLFAYTLGMLNKSSLKRVSTYMTCLGSLGFFILMLSITNATTSDKYQITATLNPLSTMIQGKLEGKNIDRDLAAINKVIDLSVVKQYPSYDEIPSFWLGIRNDYYLHLKNYNSHVYDIFINNPGAFFSNRLQVFLHTNSFGRYPSLSTGQFYNSDPAVIAIIQDFYNVNKLSKPWDPSLKLSITERLLLIDDQFHPTTLAKVVWSIIPTLAGLLVLFVVSIIKRRWMYVFVTSLLALHAIIVFMTAPADYFMYYLPIYLVGNFLITLLILRVGEKRIPQLYQRLDSYLQKNLKKHRRYIFLAIGIINTLLDFLFYTFLTEVIFRSPDKIIVVGIISGTFALACAYTSHRLVTWRDKRATRATIIKFFAFTGFGLWIIRPILLSWFITLTPLYSFLFGSTQKIGLPFSEHFIASTGAFLIMVIIIMVYNYYTYARFVFTKDHGSSR